MNTLTKLASVLILLALILCWALAGWALGLQDYDAPEIMIFLGRFHPVVLHLPIGFMALALLLDLGHLLPEKWRKNLPSTTWLHALIVLSSTGAIVHGILLFASGGYEGSELAEKHLIGGCIFLTVAAATFLFKAWCKKDTLSRLIGAPMTILAMVILSISAHDGASLTHGENYLSQYAPEPLKPILEPGYKKPTPKPAQAETTFEDANVYEVAVQPIFDRVCISCHKESKSKGKLRMDTFAELIKGGAEGDAVVPGDVEGSLIITRMMLPIDDEYEEHMPPQGKPQHTEGELAVLKWWIQAGAPSDGALKSYNPPAELLPVIEGFGL